MGNTHLLTGLNLNPGELSDKAAPLRADGQTVMFVFVEDKPAGLIGVAAVLIWINPLFGILILVFQPLIMIVTRKISGRVGKLKKEQNRTIGELSDTLTQMCDLFGQIRGSLTLIGAMVARAGRIKLTMPGGDRIGRRRIDTHLLALEALGAQTRQNGDFEMSAAGLRGADIWLDEASVTGTENAVMAACLARGETIIRNAASEPHVQELCHFLRSMGAEIEGIGSHLPSADEDPEFTHGQIATFHGILKSLGGPERFRWRHLLNSAGLLAYDRGACNLSRPGLMLYGVSFDEQIWKIDRTTGAVGL